VRVDGGPDVADRYIAEHAVAGDVAVTADIPLAALLVPKRARPGSHTCGTAALTLGHTPPRYLASAPRERRCSIAPATRAPRNAGIAVTAGQITRARSHAGRIADTVDRE
jgi:hypothetical protein